VIKMDLRLSGRLWSGLAWVRTVTGGGLLRTWWWSFGFWATELVNYMTAVIARRSEHYRETDSPLSAKSGLSYRSWRIMQSTWTDCHQRQVLRNLSALYWAHFAQYHTTYSVPFMAWCHPRSTTITYVARQSWMWRYKKTTFFPDINVRPTVTF
jgi:hypothetical protein